MKIAVVGLGLIGGSMAKSIKAKTAHEVFGIDLDTETMMFARLCGAIDGTLDEAAVKDSDIILLAVRPNAAVKWVCDNADSISENAILVDLCGIKREVCRQIAPIAKEKGFAYVGGHPMAGKERGGFVNSCDDLFDGASMILTPDESSDPVTLERLKDFFTDIGFGTVTFSNPDEHDRIIAYTSQLAHIASSAYVKSPEAQRRRGFSAGSFRDMTRVARLDENMWTELFMDNCDYLTQELEILIENLNDYLDALKTKDADKMRRLLKDGREKKASAGGN